MKKLIVTSVGLVALSVSVAGFAHYRNARNNNTVVPGPKKGFYIDVQAGGAWSGADKTATTEEFGGGVSSMDFATTNSVTNSGGFTVRLAGGYNFNRYFGVEAGISYLPGYTERDAGPSIPEGINLNQTQENSLYAIDLIAKATIPYKQFFGFVGGGMAYVHKTAKDSEIVLSSGSPPVSTPPVKFANAASEGFIRPKIEVGAGYYINNNLAFDVVYSRIFGKGDVGFVHNSPQDFLPDINSITAGVIYHV